jgi:hypothetical protein
MSSGYSITLVVGAGAPGHATIQINVRIIRHMPARWIAPLMEP